MKQNKPKIGNLGFYAVKKKVASIKKSRPAWGVFTFSKGIWQFAGAGRKGSTLHWLTPNAMVQSTAGPELQRMGHRCFQSSHCRCSPTFLGLHANPINQSVTFDLQMAGGGSHLRKSHEVAVPHIHRFVPVRQSLDKIAVRHIQSVSNFFSDLI